ncbi:MAG: acyltransferase, partial [Deltaproteobacteria bacterium]|nr:acyltransferase [Deltaproteobacteria bacterium]
MVTRCLENRVFAVTANRVGFDERAGGRLDFIGMSEIVAPDG